MGSRHEEMGFSQRPLVFQDGLGSMGRNDAVPETGGLLLRERKRERVSCCCFGAEGPGWEADRGAARHHFIGFVTRPHEMSLPLCWYWLSSKSRIRERGEESQGTLHLVCPYQFLVAAAAAVVVISSCSP